MKYFKDRLFYGAISLISLGILLKTYQYLTKLENCDCFNNAHAYNSLKVNVEFLKAYQIFEIFLVAMFVTIFFFCKPIRNSYDKNDLLPNFLKSSVILLLAFVNGYMGYNVFLLYNLSKARCKCIDKWQKYFIYLQGMMGSIAFLRIVFMLFLTFLLIITTHYS